jgi:hypothetical protein
MSWVSWSWGLIVELESILFKLFRKEDLFITMLAVAYCAAPNTEWK